LECKQLMLNWSGRTFLDKSSSLILHSDSSTLGWAGVNTVTGEEIQDCWREKIHLHINCKELFAAMNTVRSFAKPGKKGTFCADNVVTFAYLFKGGGRLPHLNAMVRPFLEWCVKSSIRLDLQLVKSQDSLADGPSRSPQDREDYTLCPRLFRSLLDVFKPWIIPRVDMFATPSN